MKIFLGFLILILGIFSSNNSQADPISVEATGAELKVIYQEPDKNADGTPLKDLAKTTVYFDKGQGSVKGVDVAATKETGGGSISTTFIVPMNENEEADISVWATATDKTNNESDKSNVELIRLDFLKPAPPQ